MKIAIPTQGKGGLDDKVSSHFGRAPTYTLVDDETGEVKVLNNTSHHMGGQSQPPKILYDAGTKVLVCEDLGLKAINLFDELGIKVYVKACETVGEALKMYREGQLLRAEPGSACSRHTYRKHEHGGADCGKGKK